MSNSVRSTATVGMGIVHWHMGGRVRVRTDEFTRALAGLGELAEDWPRFFARVEELVRSSTDAQQLWRLARTDPLWDSVFGEDGPPESTVRRVIARARAFERAEDRAHGLALAVRMLAVHPGMTVLDDESVARKDFLSGVEPQLRELAREAAGSSDRELRIAGAHALGCCTRVDENDLTLLASLADDKDPVVRSTAHLSRGALASRLGKRSVTPAMRRATSVLEGCAVARERLGAVGRLESADIEALVRAINVEQLLPPTWAWCWETEGSDLTTPHLALAIAWSARASLGSCPALCEALAAWAKRSGKLAYLQGELLLSLAFPREAMPPLGWVRDELDASQLAALTALANGDETSDVFAHLRLHQFELAPFLAGRDAMWKPMKVRTRAGSHSWHLARLWREVVFADADPSEAARTIVEQLDPEGVLAAVCSAGRGKELRMNFRPAAQYRQEEEPRDLALLEAVVRGLAGTGFDLGLGVRRMVDRGSNWDRSALGHVIAFTHALGVGDARVKDAEHLAWAHRFAAADAKVHEIVTTTRPTVRKRIAEHVAKLD